MTISLTSAQISGFSSAFLRMGRVTDRDDLCEVFAEETTRLHILGTDWLALADVLPRMAKSYGITAPARLCPAATAHRLIGEDCAGLADLEEGDPANLASLLQFWSEKGRLTGKQSAWLHSILDCGGFAMDGISPIDFAGVAHEGAIDSFATWIAGIAAGSKTGAVDVIS